MGLAQLFTPAGDSSSSGTDYARVVAAFEEVSLLSTREDSSLDDVLRLAGQRLCDLLGSGRCSVYLRQQDGTFRGQVGVASGRDIDTSVRKLVAGVSSDLFTAEIVRTGRPVVVADAATDPRPVKKTIRRWGVQSMLGVPLVVDGEIIGLVFVDGGDRPREYTEADVHTAQAFAGLSALVVRQSWYQERLRDYAAVMDQQRTALTESNLVHTRVTRAVLSGASVDEILSTISVLLGVKSVLYSPTLDVLAWSSADGSRTGDNPALTRKQSMLDEVQTALQTLEEGEASVMTRATRELVHRRLFAILRVDGRSGGYLELSETGNSFSPLHRRAVEQAAIALSLSTLGIQRREALRAQERELYFSDLVYGRREAGDLVERADEFGVRAEDLHAIVLLRYDKGAGAGSRGSTDLVSFFGARLQRGTHVVTTMRLPDADLLLVALPGGDSVHAADVEETLVAQVDGVLPDLVDGLNARYVVVSEGCRELGDIARATQHVRQVSSLLASGSEDARVVGASTFGVLRLIGQRTGLTGAVEYSQEVLAPVIDYDSAHGTQLESTLRAFVRHDANLRRTAHGLAIHENTVRYRLRKIREISGLAADRVESLVRIALAFEVQELLDPTRD